MRIRTRLILVFILSISCTILLLSGIAFFIAKQSSERAFQEMAYGQLERIEKDIAHYMEPGVMSMQYLAGLELVQNSPRKLTSYVATTEKTQLLYANHTEYEKQVYDEMYRILETNKNFELIFMSTS